jgi:GntR family transcriptional regulator
MLYYGSKAVVTVSTISGDPRPVYLKLREIIAAAIMDGAYPEGALLPSVRAFAAQQGANPLTVAKAYQQFQLDGIAVARRGVGIHVAPGAAERLRAAGRAQFLHEEWPLIRARLERLGIAPADLLTIDRAEPAAT